MQLGILMSGQGAQYAGMGQDLYDQEPAYRAVIDRASDLAGMDYQKLVFNDATRLNQTRYAQPAIFAMSMGIANALKPVLSPIKGALGLSLGEYSALTLAQAMDFDQAFKLLLDRGAYMQTASEEIKTEMIAVLTEHQDQVLATVEEVQAQGMHVYPANFNTPKQLVLAGDARGIAAVREIFSEAGFKVIPLAVSGAFHTPFMASAGRLLKQRLADERFKQSLFPVYSNTTGKPFVDIQTTLGEQITRPTHFTQALTAMLADDVDTLIEFGPNKSLTKFARQIADKSIQRLAVTDYASLQAVRETLAKNQEEAAWN